MSDETTELRVAEPNEELPIQEMRMALCKNCNKPIIEMPAVGWNHGFNGNPDCDAPRPGDDEIENARRVIAGEGLPENG